MGGRYLIRSIGRAWPSGIHACHGSRPSRSWRTQTYPAAARDDVKRKLSDRAVVQLRPDERAPRPVEHLLRRRVAVGDDQVREGLRRHGRPHGGSTRWMLVRVAV